MSGLSQDQEKLLNQVYFKDGVMFGRDRLYDYLRREYSDYNITRNQVATWLKNQNVNQLFKATRQTKVVQPTILSDNFKQMGVDLADMQLQEIRGYKYILVCVDMFSKKVWAEPVKNKEASTIAIAMETLLSQMPENPRVIRSDRGGEFNNPQFLKVLDNRGIKHILALAHMPQSNGQVERSNGILKRLIAKYKTQNNDYDWVKYLPKLVEAYNSTKSRVTGLAPDVIETADEATKKLVHQRIEKAVLPKRENLDANFKLGDRVRIKLNVKEEGAFVKTGAIPLWSSEVFEIAHVTKSGGVALPHYKMKDLKSGQIYDTRFYDNDLQLIEKIEHPVKMAEKFIVSHIVKAEKRGRTAGFLVKFVGYDLPEWVSRKSLNEDLPKMVKQFENNNK